MHVLDLGSRPKARSRLQRGQAPPCKDDSTDRRRIGTTNRTAVVGISRVDLASPSVAFAALPGVGPLAARPAGRVGRSATGFEPDWARPPSQRALQKDVDELRKENRARGRFYLSPRLPRDNRLAGMAGFISFTFQRHSSTGPKRKRKKQVLFF